MKVEEIEERNLEVMDHNGLDMEDVETIKNQRQMLTYFEDFIRKKLNGLKTTFCPSKGTKVRGSNEG